MHFNILSVLALAVATVVASTTPTSTFKAINPSLSSSYAEYHPIPQVYARSLTNARRLAAGLPLKAPMRRHERIARSQPSASPMSVARGYIECTDQDGNSLGFVGKDLNPFGEYAVQTDGDETQRLLVTLDLDQAATGPIDIQTLNGPDSELPYLGGIRGFGSQSTDLAVGSWNNIFFAATSQTPPESLPTNGTSSFSKIFNMDEEIQSAIVGMLICTGDKDVFASYYGTVDWVSSPAPRSSLSANSRIRTQSTRSGATSPTKPSAKPVPTPVTKADAPPLSIKEAIALKRAEAKKAQSTANTSDFISLEDASPVPAPKPEEEDALGRWPIRETIERARSTGNLNLATRSLQCIPSALFEIHLGITPDPLRSVPNEPVLPPSNPTDAPRRKGRGDNPTWYEAQDLVVLKLWNNEIMEIQHEISLFGSLKTLDLHQNKLASLPSTIANLTSLTSLDLSHNALTSLPDNIYALPALTTLNLSHNALSGLPLSAPFAQNNAVRGKQMGGSFFTPTVTRATSPLPSLLALDLSHNSIPANAIDLKLPKTLTKIDLSYNPLGIADSSCQTLLQFLGTLPKLKEIRFEGGEIDDDAFSESLFTSPPFASLQILDIGQTKVTREAVEKALKYMKQELSFDVTTDMPPAGVVRVIVGKKVIKEAWELELERREKTRKAKHADFDDVLQIPKKPSKPTDGKATQQSITPIARTEPVKESWEIEAELGLLTEGGKRRARAAAEAKAKASVGRGDDSSSTTNQPSKSAPSLNIPQYYSAQSQTLTLPSSSAPTKSATHARTFSLASPSKSSLSFGVRTDDLVVPTPSLPLSVIVKQSFAQTLRVLVLANRRLDKSISVPDIEEEVGFLPLLEELDLEGCGLGDLVQVIRPGIGDGAPTRSSEKIIPLIGKLFPTLRRLNLSHNALTSSSLINEALTDLILSAPGRHGLKQLFLRGNAISELDGFQGLAQAFKGNRQVPDWKLDELDLRDNEIGKLPAELGLLPLDVLLVDGNTFRIPQRRIWEREGTKGLLSWLRGRLE
ncbi:hypothetical protein H0H93_005516 [Arthromyces matolae]|nr:hypothetical protein H0H93_005516 [Arthromyces matolae]